MFLSRTIRALPALLLLVGVGPAARAAIMQPPFPLRFGNPEVVGLDSELGSTIDGAVCGCGRVLVIDHLNARVVAFSPAGAELWRAGRKGRGPGEFQMPYRIDATLDGGALVFDLYTSEVTRLTSEGRFQDRWALPFSFEQVDNLVALPGGGFAISGKTRSNPAASSLAVHTFTIVNGRIVHQGSFGPLPQVRDTTVLRAWGTGPIARLGAEILYVRRYPYEVYRFSAGGRQRSVSRPPFRLRGTPDDAVVSERVGRTTSISLSGADVERIGSALDLGDLGLLVSRRSPKGASWDLFSAAGSYRSSYRLPATWGTVIGYDTTRRMLWMTGTADDAPVLLRVQVTPSQSRARNP